MREFFNAYWPFIAVAVGGLIFAMMFIEPSPPRHISFAVGSPNGAYHAYAERYQRILADQGITVEILETAGSVDNLRLVRDGDADIALVQGGIANAEIDPNLNALGGLFPEPAWVFVRADLGLSDFGDLRDKSMAIGMSGSGTYALAQKLQSEWGGRWTPASRKQLSGLDAAAALQNGTLDAAFFVAAIEAPYLKPLFADPALTLLPFPRAEALARRSPSLAPQTLLRGVLEVGENRPARDIPLIAPTAQIIVPDDTHPAIEAVLLDAAHAIHAEGSLLTPAATFPDSKLTDLPLSSEARRYYRNGPTALRRWFSFGLANFLERSWVLLIPLITLMIPLARVAPPIYRWRVRRKIYVWYSDLRSLEVRGRSADSREERQQIISELRKLQIDAGKIEVPLSYTDDLYRLRSHIEFVGDLLSRLKADEKMTKEDAEKALS